MIKFFRNIRQTMIKDNRITKYLLYAVGEIILVVIGILIALQINNWNEKRVIREETELRLSKLIEDLVNDQNQLKNMQYEYSFNFHALQYLFKMSNIEPYLPDLDNIVVPSYQNTPFWKRTIPKTYDKEFIQLAFKLSQQVGIPKSSKNTYDELKSTGRFSFISKDSLRDQINTYYQRWEWLFDPNIDEFKKRWLYSLDKIGIMESNPFTIEKPLSILTNNPEYAAILRRLTREIGWYAMSSKWLLEVNTNLVKSIKAEIAQ